MERLSQQFNDYAQEAERIDNAATLKDWQNCTPDAVINDVLGEVLLVPSDESQIGWMKSEFGTEYLHVTEPDYTVYDAGTLDISGDTIRFQIHTRPNMGNLRRGAIISDDTVYELQTALRVIKERSLEGLKDFTTIVLSEVNAVNPNTGEPANGAYLIDRETYENGKPKRYGTCVLFHNAFRSGPYRDEIQEVSQIEGAIGHELAHRLDISTDNYEIGDSYFQLWKDEPPVTGYGKTHHTEDFAEAISLYIFAPDTLKQISEAKYSFIKQCYESNKE